MEYIKGIVKKVVPNISGANEEGSNPAIQQGAPGAPRTQDSQGMQNKPALKERIVTSREISFSLAPETITETAELIDRLNTRIMSLTRKEHEKNTPRGAVPKDLPSQWERASSEERTKIIREITDILRDINRDDRLAEIYKAKESNEKEKDFLKAVASQVGLKFFDILAIYEIASNFLPASGKGTSEQIALRQELNKALEAVQSGRTIEPESNTIIAKKQV